MLHTCAASWKRPLHVRHFSKTAVVASSSFPRRRSRQQGRRAGPSLSGSASSSEEEHSVRSSDRRKYDRWSPPGAATEEGDEDDALLSSPSSAAPVTGVQHAHQPAVRPKAASKSPQAVAMEEFAALERKLTPPRAAPRKTPEQVAMEEFAALERKLGPAAGTGAARSSSAKRGGSRGSPASSTARPEEPDAAECCGNGCATCVWIGYWEELQAWEEAERERREAR